jgi:hypothetical protein
MLRFKGYGEAVVAALPVLRATLDELRRAER